VVVVCHACVVLHYDVEVDEDYGEVDDEVDSHVDVNVEQVFVDGMLREYGQYYYKLLWLFGIRNVPLATLVDDVKRPLNISELSHWDHSLLSLVVLTEIVYSNLSSVCLVESSWYVSMWYEFPCV
jgi:hypothetical protein